MSNDLIKIALTMGDASGIGPELLIKAIENCKFAKDIEFILYGEKYILDLACQKFANNKDLKFKIVETSALLNESNFKEAIANSNCGVASYNAIKTATLDALSNKIDAIVTAPINKYSVNLAGIEFSGHTELIAELSKVKDYAMMQSSTKEGLRMIFVTTHIPISQVAEYTTFERIYCVTKLLNDAIKCEGINEPKLAIMGLNPHASEQGFIGNEDIEITQKVIDKLRGEGLNIDDVIVPDVLFVGNRYKKYDGIVSMYHDQGHIPFKMLAFNSGVNSTMNLPIIRTSPDHGSAFDIAWQNCADCSSFFEAIKIAYLRAKRKKEQNV